MTKPIKTVAKPGRAATPARKRPVQAAAAPNTKLGLLEDMLRRPEGATLVQLAKALAWQTHSVRGAMSGALKKNQGHKITATKADGADRVYRITG